MAVKKYEPIWGIFPSLWCCMICGVAIWKKELHDEVKCD